MGSLRLDNQNQNSGGNRPHSDSQANLSYYQRIVKDWEFDLADPQFVENFIKVHAHDSVLDHLPQPYAKDKWGWDIKTVCRITDPVCLQISFRLNGERKGFNISFHQPNDSFRRELDNALDKLKNLGKATSKKTYYYQGK